MSVTLMSVALELAVVACWTRPSLNLSGTKKPIKASLRSELARLRTKCDAFKATLTYHATTALLFVYSDMKTCLLPWALFGIAHALSASLFHLPEQSTSAILTRSPLVLLWVAINLLPFCISNQRQPGAAEEDKINKPWRPMPSQRLTHDQARSFMIAAYAVAFVASVILGGAKECLALMALGFTYNSTGAGDKSFILRGLLNGLGFVSFGAGAMDVALAQRMTFTPELTRWFGLIVLVVSTGVQTHDMYDQEGDSASGRRTLPLVIGDKAARWTILLNALVFSFVCPTFWSAGPVAYILVLALGSMVAYRTMKKRSVEQDRKTVKVWSFWLLVVYCLPLMKTLGL